MKRETRKAGFITIPEFAERELNGDDYQRGAVESARAQADKVSRAFARLLTVLICKDVIEFEKAYFVITGFQLRKNQYNDGWEKVLDPRDE